MEHPKMRLILTVKNAKTGAIREEEYDANDLVIPEFITWRRPGRMAVTTAAEAETYGRELIDAFNRSLRPGESPREFVSAELKGE